jgi:ABC-2 type transport system ATP-binding protein
VTLATGIQLHFSLAIWAVLIVVTVVNYTLLVLALVNVIPRDPAAIRFHNRWIWVVLIVLVNFLGPLAYFAVGRIDAPLADNTGAGDRPAGERAQAAVDLLYGPPPAAAASDPIPAPPAVAAPAAVELRGLSKVYGRKAALDGVDLTVPAGSIFGFLGPNGAGKTTTLRILGGLARPGAGSAAVLGRDVQGATNEVRKQVGFLPDVPGFYPWMTAPEFLRFAGRLFGLEAQTLEARIVALLDLAGLRGVDARVGTFSRGMRQRLGVAQALVNAPRLLLLDEPTSALDPIGRKEVLDMIAALAGRTTVFFSTHILADVERVCDNVAILDRGRVVEQASIDELKRRHGRGQRLLVEVDDPTRLAQALVTLPWMGLIERDGATLRLTVGDLAVAERALPGVIAASGLALRRLEADEVSLEEVFVELVGEHRS